MPDLFGPGDLKPLLKRIAEADGPLGIDTEDTGLDTHDDRMVGLVVATSTTWATYIPFRHEELRNGVWVPHEDNVPRTILLTVMKAIRESKRKLVFWNAKYDLAMLENEQENFGGDWSLPEELVEDGMIAAWMNVCGGRPPGGSFGLKNWTRHLLKKDPTEIDDLLALGGGNIGRAPLDKVASYAAADGTNTLQCHWRLMEKLKELGFEYCFTALENPTTVFLAHMNRAGALIDQEYLRGIRDTMTAQSRVLEARCNEQIAAATDGAVTTFPASSPQALSVLMFDKLKLWKPMGERGKNGAYSTAIECIEPQAKVAPSPAGREIANTLMHWRRLAKLISTYTESLLQELSSDGRLRVGINQHGTATGRFSASRIHQIPRPSTGKEEFEWERELPSIRRAFVAQEGWSILDVDYSQIELRLMAHYSQDPEMMRAYQTGIDIHQMTADAVGCTRQDAKPINFGLIYGMSAWSLSGQIGKPMHVAEKWHAGFFAKYKGVKKFHARVERQLLRDGYVTTMAGRRRIVGGIDSKEPGKKFGALRVGVNTIIQGSAADLIKIAMRNTHRRLKAEGLLNTHALMMLQVHDELVMEVRNDVLDQVAAIVKHEFEHAVELRVPLGADPHIGKSWHEAKE